MVRFCFSVPAEDPSFISLTRELGISLGTVGSKERGSVRAELPRWQNVDSCALRLRLLQNGPGHKEYAENLEDPPELKMENPLTRVTSGSGLAVE